jgi:Rrf2 family protein
MSRIVTLTEAASIALHGIILIARNGSQLNVSSIAEATKSSKHHVAKVMQRLVKENFLESHRGPTGGFKLRKTPKDITLLQIYEAIEGKIEIGQCPLEKPICPFGKCILKNTTKMMTMEFHKYLMEQTLDMYI